MNRNNFIQLTVLGTGLLVCPFALNVCTSTETEPRLAITESLLSVCDTPALIGIGKKYLGQTPQENNIGVLASLVGAGLNPESESFFTDLDRKITQEYRNGQWVEVSGWLLARTEARQCALYSLLNT
jgi:GTP-dependent phosphoenolpyruvate carboxykinase